MEEARQDYVEAATLSFLQAFGGQIISIIGPSRYTELRDSVRNEETAVSFLEI